MPEMKRVRPEQRRVRKACTREAGKDKLEADSNDPEGLKVRAVGNGLWGTRH